MLEWFMRVGLALGSLLCIRVFWELRKVAQKIVNEVTTLG